MLTRAGGLLRCSSSRVPSHLTLARLNLRQLVVFRNSSRQSRLLSTSQPLRVQYVRFNNSPGGYQQYYQRHDLAFKIAGTLLAFAGGYYLYHLEKIPETGRWRFNDIPVWAEEMLAESTQSELLSEYSSRLLPPNHPVTRHVEQIVSNILDASNLGTVQNAQVTPFSDQGPFGSSTPAGGAGQNPGESGAARKWNVMVVNDEKIVNAMATWGNIVVFTGIFSVCKGADSLAAILGHEIAHATLRHPSERLAFMKVFLLLSVLLEVLQLDLGFARLFMTLALDLPNSRKQELEADMVGLIYASKACYDPRAAPEVQTRLHRLEQSRHKSGLNLDFDFLRTHPASDARAKILEAHLSEAYDARASNERCSGMEDAFGKFRDTFQGGAAFGSGASGMFGSPAVRHDSSVWQI